ncbi:hypothetical protein O5D80_005164 [Batrachochytrium dendrobatidis]|nr:hypothetical protein O5D80_005164 [Batrachochytrium dendrobatidis]
MTLIYNLLNQTNTMKLSIAVLSSILAVCSVTVANPVDPSSTMSAEASTSTTSTEASTYTMSAEASTPTASTSGASAGGSDYSSSPSSYDEFEKYCYSFSLDQAMLIKRLAKAEAQFPGLSKKTNDKRHQHAAQKKVVDELQDTLDGLYGAMHLGLEISELAELEAELLKQRKILEKIEEELSVCSINFANKIDEGNYLQKKLKKQPLIGSSSIAGDGFLDLRSVSGYNDCYHYFYNRFLQ